MLSRSAVISYQLMTPQDNLSLLGVRASNFAYPPYNLHVRNEGFKPQFHQIWSVLCLNLVASLFLNFNTRQKESQD